MEIRQAEAADLQKIIEMEQICFPKAEAACAKDLKARYAAFGDSFFVAEEEGTVIGYINGCATEQPALPDELYHNASLHNPKGAYQTVFGLGVLPEYRKRGVGRALLRYLTEITKERGKSGMILTCKDYLIPFYQRAGFVHLGRSVSSHGGAEWNDMLLTFTDEMNPYQSQCGTDIARSRIVL